MPKAVTDKNRGMVLGLYAQAGFFIAGQQLTTDVMEVVEQALRADPYEVTALGLKGVDAFAKQDYAIAIANWQRAADNTENDENRQTLLRGIAQANQRIAGDSSQLIEDRADALAETEAVSSATAISSTNFGSLLVNVSIDPKLAQGLNPDLWVYVFAKAINGPRAPLAANRYKVSDLPTQVRLDDAMAMNPSLKVSGFSQVAVVARISQSGQPIAGSNDLQGSTTVTRKDSSQTGVQVVIDSILP